MKLFFWGIYFLVIKFLSLLVFWIPEFQERKKFERKNLSEIGARSFKNIQVEADLCFEFSSEGEYQQVASLIDDALYSGKRVELVFFSPSVEKTILELAAKWPENIRYLRYPLVSFSFMARSASFGRWITSKKLILVRYDLFPEFLIWSMDKKNELSMIWMTFKKERKRGKKISLTKQLFLKQAKKIIFASKIDGDQGRSLGRSGSSYDFRIEQIRRRVAVREEKFSKQFPSYSHLKNQFDRYPREKRLIIGNAWPSDLFLLENLPDDYFVVIVPHLLTADILSAFRIGLESLERRVVEVGLNFLPESGDTFLINMKGVLCELYADFGRAYVGGGFEVSVHSILEPLVAGAEKIAVGPKNDRSTEFDVASEMGRISETKSSKQFNHWLEEKSTAADKSVIMKSIFDSYTDFRREIISC